MMNISPTGQQATLHQSRLKRLNPRFASGGSAADFGISGFLAKAAEFNLNNPKSVLAFFTDPQVKAVLTNPAKLQKALGLEQYAPPDSYSLYAFFISLIAKNKVNYDLLDRIFPYPDQVEALDKLFKTLRIPDDQLVELAKAVAPEEPEGDAPEQVSLFRQIFSVSAPLSHLLHLTEPYRRILESLVKLPEE